MAPKMKTDKPDVNTDDQARTDKDKDSAMRIGDAIHQECNSRKPGDEPTISHVVEGTMAFLVFLAKVTGASHEEIRSHMIQIYDAFTLVSTLNQMADAAEKGGAPTDVTKH